MSTRDYWVMSGCYVGLSVLYCIGAAAIMLLASFRSIEWFIKQPFRLLAAGWRAVRG